MNQAGNLEQIAAFTALGVAAEKFLTFLQNEVVVYLFPTMSGHGIAMLQKLETRLMSGVIEINDKGGGHLSLLRFRNRSFDLARSMELAEAELFGAAIVNPEVERILAKLGFGKQTIPCPDELGNEMMSVYTKVFPVS